MAGSAGSGVTAAKGAVVEQCGEILLEDKARQIGGTERQAQPVAQYRPCAAVAQNQLGGGCRQFPVHRHRDQAGAHDAEKGG